MPSHYSFLAILVLTGILFLGFRSEINSRIGFYAIQEGIFRPSDSNGSISALSSQMMSFEEWLLLHKVRKSRQGEGDRNPNGSDSIQNSFYASSKEFDKRRRIYKENLSRWAELNKISGGATYGPEKEPYADKTPQEFAHLVGSCYRSTDKNDETRHSGNSNIKQQVQSGHRNHQGVLRSQRAMAMKTAIDYNDQALHKAFTIMDVDWRAHAPSDQRQTSYTNSTNPTALVSYVTPVKNQGPHGTCWSFAAAENLEGLAVQQGHPLQNISEQEFISCCSDCQGRSADHTFSWLLQETNGVPALEES